MSIQNRLKTCIRDVADFPKPGILFKDISTIMLDAELSADVLNHLVETYQNYGYKLIEVPKDSVDNRILFILDQISN